LYFRIKCHGMLAAFKVIRGTLLEQVEQLDSSIHLSSHASHTLMLAFLQFAAKISPTSLTAFMNISYIDFGNEHRHLEATMLQLLRFTS